MKNRYVIVAAVLLGLFTCFMIFNFLREKEAAATRDYEEVYTLAGDVAQKTVIKEEMLVKTRMPKEAIHAQAVRKIEDAVGYITLNPLVKGEQLLKTRIAKPGDPTNGLSYTVPPGKRGITVGVDDVSGVAGFVRPGDHVDVVGTITVKENNNDVSYTLIVLQDILVLATGKQLDEKNNKNSDKEGSEYKTITVAVTPEQSRPLVLASQKGVIRLMLRSPVDSSTVNTTPIKPENLIK